MTPQTFYPKSPIASRDSWIGTDLQGRIGALQSGPITSGENSGPISRAQGRLDRQEVDSRMSQRSVSAGSTVALTVLEHPLNSLPVQLGRILCPQLFLDVLAVRVNGVGTEK